MKLFYTKRQTKDELCTVEGSRAFCIDELSKCTYVKISLGYDDDNSIMSEYELDEIIKTAQRIHAGLQYPEQELEKYRNNQEKEYKKEAKELGFDYKIKKVRPKHKKVAKAEISCEYIDRYIKPLLR